MSDGDAGRTPSETELSEEDLAAVEAMTRRRLERRARAREAFRERIERRLELSEAERDEMDRERYRGSARPGGMVLIDDIAFLRMYGTGEELYAVLRQLPKMGALATILRDPQPADAAAHAGLVAIMARVQELAVGAWGAEHRLRECRWEFNPETGKVRSIGNGPGRPRNLVTEFVNYAFQSLTEYEGWERSNTVELREAIRAILAPSLPVEYLSTDRGEPIHSAVNSLLNTDRHY